MTSCASGPPSSQPASAPARAAATPTAPTIAPAAALAPTPWAWRTAPKFSRCPDGVPFRYCLTLDDGRLFLHWQEEQKAGVEEALGQADGLYREEKGRREALEAGPGLGVGRALGVAGGVLGALGVGLLVGWLWGHFGTPRTALEVPASTQRVFEPLDRVPVP